MATAWRLAGRYCRRQSVPWRVARHGSRRRRHGRIDVKRRATTAIHHACTARAVRGAAVLDGTDPDVPCRRL